jgi:hypothetical protein
MRIDPTGMLDDGYTVDDKGKIEKVDNTGGNKYDVLYTKKDYEKAKKSGKKNEYGNPEPEKQVKVNDTGILKGLSHWKKDPQGYAVYHETTENRNDAFNVYSFVTDNSNVEWSLNGFNASNKKEYVIGAYQLDNQSPAAYHVGRDEMTQFFEIHSHPDSDGTKGASGDWRKTKGVITGDFSRIRDRNDRFIEANKRLFPHYVYHKHSKVLYYYTPENASIYVRKINKGSDYSFGAF